MLLEIRQTDISSVMNPAVFAVMWPFCVRAYKYQMVRQVQRALKALSEITWNILAERHGAVVWLEPKAEPKATVSIPFVKEVSERIKRIFAKRGTQVYFRSLEQHQAKEGPRDNKVVIYQIPCLDCDKSYIETRWTLKTRLTDHQRSCQNREVQRSGWHSTV